MSTAAQNDIEFKLRCELIGHSKDVRALTEINLGQNKSTIVSGSRDLTVRFWDEKDESHFAETHCAKGHTNFVGAITFMAPPPGSSGSSATGGKAFSGSNDGSIRAYDAETADFLYVLNGHQNAVTCLTTDETRHLLISGSADTTIIIWRDEQCLKILAGHLHVVWAIFVVPSESNDKKLPSIMSGSADKTIQLWSDGTSVKTYSGHKDCIRGLVPVNQSEFLSASNDATIKRWNIKTGACIMTYSGHDGFIYTIAFHPSYNYFATGAEDKSIRIWNVNNEVCLQTIYVPAQSIWSVIILANGDIACGSSDATIRIFTQNSNRVAKPDVLAAYDEQVKAFCTASNSGEIGGIKITDLPGIEVLRQVGIKDGQTKMVRVGDKVEIYSWSDAKAKWDKVGDVLGSKESNEGKKMFMGKEYDYVFDVDVEDGKPTLKLPYNMNEDPWVVAQKFIHDNFLPQSYLETVANFITKNASATNVSATANRTDSNFGDPFTGAGRYIPGEIGGTVSHNYSDPFTGAGRYVPAGADLSKVDPKRPRGENIPLNDYITFSASAGLLLGKLKENNAQVFDALRLNEKHLEVVENLIAKKQFVAEDIIEPLNIMLRWPKQHLTPCLDVLRLALLNKSVTDHFFSTLSRGKEFADKLCCLIHESNAPFGLRILVPRCFANSLYFESSRNCLITISDIICRVLIEKCLFNEKPAAHIATAACLANFSFAFFKDSIDEFGKTKKKDFSKQLFEGINKNAKQFGQFDQQALFYLLQSFVTLLWGDDEIIKLAGDNNLKLVVEKLKDVSFEEKSKIIARCVERML